MAQWINRWPAAGPAFQFDDAADDHGWLRHDSVRQDRVTHPITNTAKAVGTTAWNLWRLAQLFDGNWLTYFLTSDADFRPTPDTFEPNEHDADLQRRLNFNKKLSERGGPPVAMPKDWEAFEPGDVGPAVDPGGGHFVHPDDSLEQEEVEPAVIDDHNYGTRGLEQPYYMMQRLEDIPKPPGRAYGVRKFANKARRPAMY